MADRKTYGDFDPKQRECGFVARDEQPALWTYCCRRFEEFWKQHGVVNRRVPLGYRDKDNGKAGWFFPTKWVQDFGILPRQDDMMAAPPKGSQLSMAARIAFVDRVIAPKANRISGDNRVSAPEAERWQLPVGTKVSAFEVEYPDGTRESVDDLRMRHGKYHPGAPRQSAEQQLLEDTLRTLHRKNAA